MVPNPVADYVIKEVPRRQAKLVAATIP